MSQVSPCSISTPILSCSSLSKDGPSSTRCTFSTAPSSLLATNQKYFPIENTSPHLESALTIVQKWSPLVCPPTMTCASSARVQQENFSALAPIVYRA